MSCCVEKGEIGSGEAVLARPGEDHGVKNAASEELVLLVFMTPRP
jgi:mannose-6-phosphate isomerase-like protein (cupin superfamily)